MPCHAMPCHAMPCHAMPCHAMPCQVEETSQVLSSLLHPCNPSSFMQLRTLFRNGTPLSPLFSVASALFLSRRGWYPPCRSQPREPITSLWMGRRYSQALCFHQPAASYS